VKYQLVFPRGWRVASRQPEKSDKLPLYKRQQRLDAAFYCRPRLVAYQMSMYVVSCRSYGWNEVLVATVLWNRI
jgi:hypothetical protein